MHTALSDAIFDAAMPNSPKDKHTQTRMEQEPCETNITCHKDTRNIKFCGQLQLIEVEHLIHVNIGLGGFHNRMHRRRLLILAGGGLKLEMINNYIPISLNYQL